MGWQQIAIFAVIIFILFGAGSLPKFARSLGQVLPSFKAGMKEMKDELDEMGEEVNKMTKDLKDSIKS